MITLLARIFIREDDKPEKIRLAYGILCGIVGILLNVLLFTGKFIAGTISKSIAITADAFNNLSDAGSSIVTLLGFKLGAAKPDPEHPFGHGRMEYVSGLVVAAVILIMAVELIQDSIRKILHPEATECSVLIIVILLISIAVKLYMTFYNRRVAKKINSAAMRATAMDSLSDSITTSVVLITTLIAEFTSVNIDGYCGVAVGLFILYGGINAAKETLNPLLGQPPEEEFVKEIEHLVLEEKMIIGIHDLVVHDYGPGRLMVSLHAEVPAEMNILVIHDMIDNVEMKLKRELNCEAVIHMDPVITGSKELTEIKETVTGILKDIDEVITMHDFRMVQGPTHTNLIFDVVIPFGYRSSDEAVLKELEHQVKEKLGEQYHIVVNVDKNYVK